MPVFGEYETLGEPVAVTEERGHTSTVWQGRLVGSKDGRLFAIKCYQPRPRQSKPGESEESLQKDRALEFLEAVKQLKKARSEGGRCLSPIHVFGIVPEGAWYVTDFYPGKTLKELIVRRGRVDSAALRHVVRSVVAGCLALKRSRGYSHGNLKAANVSLVGKPRALSQRPIELGDPYPASARQLSNLDDQDQKAVNELLNQTVEAQDLRSLGELLLQLVRGRLIANAFDFDYPIARSPAWDNLGKDGENWRELCNQLLSPQLSLDCVSLELLEKKFQPTIAPAQLRIIAMAAGAVILITGILYTGAVVRRGKQRANFKEHVHQAEAAWATTNLMAAQKEINLALTFDPRDSAAANSAKDLKGKIDQRLDEYTRALTDTRREYKAGNPGTAAQRLADAVRLYPDGALIPTEREYGEALTQARKDLEAQQWTNVIANANRVLAIEKTDDIALKMKTEAETRIASITQAAAQQKQQQINKTLADFDDAMTAARAALEQTNSSAARPQFDTAKRLARDLQDAAREKEADGGLILANQITEALAANKAGNVADELSWLQQASTAKSAPKMLSRWFTDAQARQKAINNQKQSGEKLADFNASLGKARAFLEATNSAKAKTEFETAKRLARDLQDSSKENEANEGLILADQLGSALTAKNEDKVDDEVNWLQKAAGSKNQPKMLAMWLSDARQRQKMAAQRAETTQKLTALTTALTKGRSLLEQTNTTAAKTEFQNAKLLAHELKDSQKEKDADDGLKLVDQLANALTAKAAGKLEDEISWLEKANASTNPPKMAAGWLANARQRQKAMSDQKLAALKLDEYASSIKTARAFLEQTNGVAAKPEFQKAKSLARDLQDSEKEASADEGLALVDQLAGALAANKAGNLDDEVSWLQKAGANKNQPKMLATWLANAQVRQKMINDQKETKQKLTDFSTALSKGRSFLEQTNTVDAKQQFQTAKRLARDLQDPAKERDADEGLLISEQLGNALVAMNGGKIDDELGWLQKAGTNKNAPRIVALWLQDAKAKGSAAADSASLAGAMTRGAAALSAAQYSPAETNFTAATGLAGKLNDSAAVTKAQQLKDFAASFAAVVSLGAEQGARAFDSALDALKKASEPSSPVPVEALGVATNVLLKLATNACQAAFDVSDRQEATAWLARLQNLGEQAVAFATIMQPKITVLKDWPGEYSPFHGIIFVRVGKSPTAGKMFYASKYEITASQFKEIYGVETSTQPAMPADCDPQVAKDFCLKLKKTFDDECNKPDWKLGIKSGSIRLPSVDEYLYMTRLNDGKAFDKNYVVTQATLQRLRAPEGDNPPENFSGKLAPAVGGHTNSLGLVNVVGNIPEWSENGQVLGLTYYAKGVGQGKVLINSEPVPNTLVGLRPVLIPED
jgi:hypothetical protein